MYRCNECKKIFKYANFYDEKHGLDCPPYERVAVCPFCDSTDFCEYSASVSKDDIKEKLLPAIAALNRYWRCVEDIYGGKCANDDFYEGITTLTELVSELFPFMSLDDEKLLYDMRTEKEVEKVILKLEG